MGRPFWRDDVMREESCLFVRRGEGPTQARLLLGCDELLAATDMAGEVAYGLGDEIRLEDDGRTLTLAEGSQAPWKREVELYPPQSLSGAIPTRLGGNRWLLFAEGPQFAQWQVRVTYRHGGWDGPVPEVGAGLPRTLARLRAGSLRVVLFGDSISAGGNATALYDVPPRQPPYGTRVVERLRDAFGAEIAYTNLSVGGMDSAWGVRQVGAVGELAPDLAILAWGMNDASGGRSVEAFTANIRTQMEAVRAAQPEADLVLVASMWGNREWTAARPDLYPRYRDALAELAASDEGVALADLTTLWGWMLRRKRFVDLTGNGVNHANDFGHGLYADVVTAAILGEGD